MLFKKLYTCLQFWKKKNAGFIFLTFSENWPRIFVNRIKTKNAETRTLKTQQATLTAANAYLLTVLKSES